MIALRTWRKTLGSLRLNNYIYFSFSQIKQFNMKIYHNPRCSKSRETLHILQDNNQDIEVVEYLKTPPTRDELKMLLQKLNMKAEEIVRKSELVYKEKFKNSNFTEEEWIQIMMENPKLIERPIVVKGNKAVLGRPPENVKELF